MCIRDRLEAPLLHLESALVAQSLLHSQNMVKPAVDDMHQRLFVDIAKEVGIYHLYCLLVENAVDQLQPVLVDEIDCLLLA